MASIRLTDSFIRSIKVPEDKVRVEYSDNVVLNLVIRATRKEKRFSLRYRYGGKSKRISLGRYPEVTLAEARQQAKEYKHQIRQGIDPMQVKTERIKKATERITLEEAFEKYITSKKKVLRDETTKTYISVFKNKIAPAFKGYYLEDITKKKWVIFLERLGHESPYYAKIAQATLSALLTWALDRELIESRFNVPKGVMKDIRSQAKPRKDVYSPEQIREWLTWAGQHPHPMVWPYLRALFLMGQRKSETHLLQWDWIKDDAIELPEEVTKAKRKQVLPLTRQMRSLLDQLYEQNHDQKYVFADPVTKKPFSITSYIKKGKSPYSLLHSIRHTVETHLAKLGVRRDIQSKILNHADSSMTAIYDHHDYKEEMRHALQQWADRLDHIIEGQQAANVRYLGGK